jgi:EmrB/QacA subfamily drug resistance transporter
MFLAALDQTIVATALPTIGVAFHDFTNLPWIVTAYLIAATAIAPLYGKFSDIHGRRITILVGVVTFMVGSLAAALAPNMLVLIAARAVQGLGGGGLIALAQTVVGDIVAPRERGRYQGYFSAVFAASSIAGPVLGGLIAEHLHWSLIFWINLPLGFLALAITGKTLKRVPRHERWHRLDVLGAVLIVLASSTVMLALSWGGETLPWTSPAILGLLGASLVLWVLFVIRLMTAEEPLVGRAVLANNVVRTGLACSGLSMGTLIGLTVFLPVYFQAVEKMSAGQSGLALIPLSVGVVIGATYAGRRTSRVKHYKLVSLIGLALAPLGCLLLAFFTETMPFWMIEVVLATLSAGMGTVLPVTTIAVQNAVALHELGTVTAAVGFFRQLGGALMVAALGAIVLRSGSLASLTGAADASMLIGPFRTMYLTAAAVFLAALVLLALMEERPLHGKVERGA